MLSAHTVSHSHIWALRPADQLNRCRGTHIMQFRTRMKHHSEACMISAQQAVRRRALCIAAPAPSLRQESSQVQEDELEDEALVYDDEDQDTHDSDEDQEMEEEEDLVLMREGPAAQLGPMHLTTSAGCGVGFVTSRNVREGEVLLVSAPLFQPLPGTNRTQPPSGLDLANHMSTLQPSFSHETQQWLQLLHVGVSGEGEGNEDSSDGLSVSHTLTAALSDNGLAKESRLSRLERLLPRSLDHECDEDEETLHAETPDVEQLDASSEICSSDVSAQQAHFLLDWASITAMVNFNSYADVGEDAAIVICRGQTLNESNGFAGMWGSFSLLNHSCSPNASYLVINQQMVVHAARAIPCGEEVSINYFGARVLQPAEERRKYLKENYGFQCRCPRCMFESSLSTATREQISGSANTASMMGDVLEEGSQRGDAGIHREVVAMLGNYQDEIYKLGDRLRVTEQQRFWIQASAYPIYEGILRLRTHALQQQVLFGGSSSSRNSTTGHGSSHSTHNSSSGAETLGIPEDPHPESITSSVTEQEEEEQEEYGEEGDQERQGGRGTARRRGTVYRKSSSRGQKSGSDSAAAAARAASRARALLLRCIHEEVEAIDFCMEAVAEVACGSDLHVSLAEQRLRAAQIAFAGADRASSAMQEAERSCYDAWCTRYGQLSFGGYTSLLAAKRSLGV